jgi:hypothetical protein
LDSSAGKAEAEVLLLQMALPFLGAATVVRRVEEVVPADRLRGN